MSREVASKEYINNMALIHNNLKFLQDQLANRMTEMKNVKSSLDNALDELKSLQTAHYTHEKNRKEDEKTMNELWRAHSINLETHKNYIKDMQSGLTSLQKEQLKLSDAVDTLRKELSNLVKFQDAVNKKIEQTSRELALANEKRERCISGGVLGVHLEFCW